MESTLDWEGFTYLGVPISKPNSKIANWEPVLDKIKGKIQNWSANWLNPAGKLILLKSVLNSMPIYQSSILLAPCSVLSKIESLFRKFIWEGGKGNEKKLHLVSWEKIQKPRAEGGLQVRSLASQNLALGAKLLWHLISGKDCWSKQVLRKKYFPGSRKRCLDSTPQHRNGSPVFKLCIKALPSFKKRLYWIPGNGKTIRIWEDPILGDTPLGHCQEVRNIKRWLLENGTTTLWDLSAWENSNWIGWNLGNLPPDLEEEVTTLTVLLQGKSPFREGIRDRRGWGIKSGNYTASEGYENIQSIPYVTPNPVIWNFVWSRSFIPKIDFFCWTLAHRSILTGENLKKRGMEGPSRCPLCKKEEETSDHLLLGCPFSKEVWKETLKINSDITLPGTIHGLLAEWMKLSPFQLPKKSLLQTAWSWVSKAILWKIWLERNNRIFRDK